MSKISKSFSLLIYFLPSFFLFCSSNNKWKCIFVQCHQWVCWNFNFKWSLSNKSKSSNCCQSDFCLRSANIVLFLISIIKETLLSKRSCSNISLITMMYCICQWHLFARSDTNRIQYSRMQYYLFFPITGGGGGTVVKATHGNKSTNNQLLS